MQPDREKKSSFKRRQAPAVRQTRTSAYRILKANPLMMYDSDSVKKMGIQNVNAIPKTVDILGISSKTNEISLAPESKNNCFDRQPGNIMHNSSNIYVKESVRTSISTMYRQMKNVRRSRSVEDFNPKKCIKKNIDKNIRTKLETSCSLDNLSHCLQYKKYIVNRKHRENSCTEVGLKANVIKKSTATAVKEQKSRRSRSVENCNSKNSKHKIVAKDLQVYNSVDDLTEAILDSSISPIKKEQPLFKTPIAYKQRSSKYRKSIYNKRNSTPAPVDLQKRLNDWLSKRGKSLSSFQHLKCFGLCNSSNLKPDLDKLNDIENKENRDTQVRITETVDNVYNSSACTKDPEIIARGALNDLYKLIQDGYSVEQCEGWLGRIHQRYQKLEEEPLYWECRAICEQSKGNISSAIEHYRKAIIKGAEVEDIEESLDQLLEKFSLLNIDPDFHKENNKEKRIILDARNAFKSTIIQFAVQERMLKKKEEETKKKLIVTPVRRSIRLSEKHSGCSRLKLCSSIKDIQMDDNTEFRKNSYLSIRFSP